jgi:hypothetical protein
VRVVSGGEWPTLYSIGREPVVACDSVHHSGAVRAVHGPYQHYVSTFLNPINLLWSFLQVVPMALMILLVHPIDYSRYYVRRRRGGSDTTHRTAQIHTTTVPAR